MDPEYRAWIETQERIDKLESQVSCLVDIIITMVEEIEVARSENRRLSEQSWIRDPLIKLRDELK